MEILIVAVCLLNAAASVLLLLKVRFLEDCLIDARRDRDAANRAVMALEAERMARIENVRSVEVCLN